MVVNIQNRDLVAHTSSMYCGPRPYLTFFSVVQLTQRHVGTVVCRLLALRPMFGNAGWSGQSARQVHDALPLAPAVLDRSRIRCKQFRGITPLHGCRVREPVALISLGGAA